MRVLILLALLCLSSCSDPTPVAPQAPDTRKWYVHAKHYHKNTNSHTYSLEARNDTDATTATIPIDYEVYCISFIGQQVNIKNGVFTGLTESAKP